jgi:hypothetical protein
MPWPGSILLQRRGPADAEYQHGMNKPPTWDE